MLFFTECRKSSGKLPIVGTSGTLDNQVNGASVAEHTSTLLHQADSKNCGEAKAVVILEPNPKEIAVSAVARLQETEVLAGLELARVPRVPGSHGSIGR